MEDKTDSGSESEQQLQKPKKYTLKQPYVQTEARKMSFKKAKQKRMENIQKQKEEFLTIFTVVKKLTKNLNLSM